SAVLRSVATQRRSRSSSSDVASNSPIARIPVSGVRTSCANAASANSIACTSWSESRLRTGPAALRGLRLGDDVLDVDDALEKDVLALRFAIKALPGATIARSGDKNQENARKRARPKAKIGCFQAASHTQPYGEYPAASLLERAIRAIRSRLST